jgi:hypothetical protein
MLWSAGYFAIANIGNSRAYLVRNGMLSPLTEDHVLSNLIANPKPPAIGGHLVRFLDSRPGSSTSGTASTGQGTGSVLPVLPVHEPGLSLGNVPDPDGQSDGRAVLPVIPSL